MHSVSLSADHGSHPLRILRRLPTAKQSTVHKQDLSPQLAQSANLVGSRDDQIPTTFHHSNIATHKDGEACFKAIFYSKPQADGGAQTIVRKYSSYPGTTSHLHHSNQVKRHFGWTVAYQLREALREHFRAAKLDPRFLINS